MKSYFDKVKIFIFRPKTMDYSPWFDFWESKNSFEKRIPSERASQEEHSDTSLSFVAPSIEELEAFEIYCCDDLYHACTFQLSVTITLQRKVLRS